MSVSSLSEQERAQRELILGAGTNRARNFFGWLGRTFLLAVTSVSALAVLFIFAFIIKDALPFFDMASGKQFFTTTAWYPSHEPPRFGALPIFVGTGLVTMGAVLLATPLGVIAALCLSDVLPFGVRQIVKPIIEILAAIPSVAYGFFALVVFAPMLQEQDGTVLAWIIWVVGLPIGLLGSVVFADLISQMFSENLHGKVRLLFSLFLGALTFAMLFFVGNRAAAIDILSGANAMNAAIILGIMALPTVVSVSEDALSAVGRELREGSYGLGATRAETLVKVVVPAASSGIVAAVLLGIMRAVGETMVVWMAAGNAAQVPEPIFNLLVPVRTLTATIAGDMGETAIGSAHYHCLFLMALCLLSFSFVCNLLSEWSVRRTLKKMGG